MNQNLYAAIQQAIDALEEGHNVSIGEFGDTAHAEQFTAAIASLQAVLAEQAELDAEVEQLKQARVGTTWAKPCNFGGLNTGEQK